jgi:two-component system response regulator AtoC
MIENLQPTVMVVDDEPSMLRYMQTTLELDSYKVITAMSGAECLQMLATDRMPDLVFLDMLMPGLDGLQTLERIRQIKPCAKVVMLSCVSDTAKVVQSIRLGAQDYITKPFEKHSLEAVLQRYIGPNANGDAATQCEIEELEGGHYFIAGCAAMKKIRAEVALIANIDVPLLILGESGTGKEVIARLIHERSRRANRPFIKVNCAALPGDLLESELFGYEPGAFTGANKSKPGKFELCDKGTLLLDEIGEIPVHLQAKLLHVLQDGEFSRLGSRNTVKVDVRVLAATNIDVKAAIVTHTFREDLFYRLNGFTINVPPLRERQNEIPTLLRHIMVRMAESYGREPLEFSPALLRACMSARWPGNVRELSNFVKRYLILGDEQLALEELAPSDAGPVEANGNAKPVATAESPADLKSIGRGLKNGAEHEAISRALARTRWNRKRAAESLNISYKALLYKIRQYNIRPPHTGGDFLDRDVS